MFAGQRMGQRSALNLFSPGSFGKRTMRKCIFILSIGALSKRTWREKVAGGPHAFEIQESNLCESVKIRGSKLCGLKT
jgi:hypothetical protein